MRPEKVRSSKAPGDFSPGDFPKLRNVSVNSQCVLFIEYCSFIFTIISFALESSFIKHDNAIFSITNAIPNFENSQIDVMIVIVNVIINQIKFFVPISFFSAFQ